MPVDMDWVREQMTAAKVKQSVGTSVLRLLEVWDTMSHKPDSAKETVEIFGKLALGHALIEAESDEFNGTWVPTMAGQIKMADIVRVKSDAFDGPAGQVSNGRIARVVGLRYGDVIVKSVDGKEPVLDGAHYKPNLLEKLVRS